jgi:hypothetical protein
MAECLVAHERRTVSFAPINSEKSLHLNTFPIAVNIETPLLGLDAQKFPRRGWGGERREEEKEGGRERGGEEGRNLGAGSGPHPQNVGHLTGESLE